ncbi:MAG: hypothetical protein ACRC8K_02480, partial [Waterburya sp.]
MTTLTYCKGLPTPIEELNPLGFSNLEMFLTEFSTLFRQATLETVNHLLELQSKFDKSKWNTHLQQSYGISKRHANGVIVLSWCKVDSAKKCRANHIKQLEAKLKSAEQWLSKTVKKLRLAQKFYRKKNWIGSKTGCNFPLSTSLFTKKTNWHQTKFKIHHKKRYIFKLKTQISHLKLISIKVKVNHGEVFI